MTHRLISALTLGIAMSFGAFCTANAADLTNVNRLSQAQFELLASDLGSAFAIRGFSTGASIGLPGVDVGVGLGVSQIGNRAVWEAASTGSVPSNLPISTWRAQVGLPFNVDLAGHYVIAHSTNLRHIGTDLRWGFVQEQLTVPGVSLGLSYSRMVGVDTLSFDTIGLNVTASKSFRVVTPYAGIGRVWSETEAKNAPNLRHVSNSQSSLFAGVRLNLIFNLAIEVERTGGITNYGVKYGLHF